MAVAVEKAALYAIPSALLAGEIASGADFADGQSAARYLEQESKNALSAISGWISCKLFTVAAFLELENAASTDASSCGVVARKDIGNAPPPPVNPPNDDAEDGDPCEEQFQSDLQQCKAVSAGRGGGYGKPEGRIWFKTCEAIAKERYAQCLAGKPLSPFNPWDI